MITPGLCSSYLAEVLAGVHQITDEYRLALFSDQAEISPASTTYTTSGEVPGTGGYVAGGQVLTGFSITESDGVAIADFDDARWMNATITARGAMIYNASKGNRAVLVLDFGGNIASTAGLFSVIFPPPTTAEALIRLA